MSDAVRYSVDDGLAWLVIDRPDSRNALSSEVRTGLWDGFRRFGADDAAGAMILTAEGDKAFCAGGDLKEMASTSLEVPPPDFLPILHRNIDIDKPVIAAVNGVAFAGGFLLAQMCDLVVAADTARFAVTEAKVGRGTPWATPLPFLIPPRVAMELLVTGEPMDAQRAYEVGLVNRVVPLADLRAEAERLARTILANAPLSVRAAKRTVWLGAAALHRDLYDEADQIWEPVYKSQDAQEGPLAFREKRAPNWQGR